MNADQVERLAALFAEADDYPPDQQAAFLTRACSDDALLRREVAALLRCEGNADDFLEEPAFGHGLAVLQRTAAGELKAGDTVGDCRVVSLLGVGGMGEVYLAEDTIHHRAVALKLIGQGRAEDVRGRHFRHERKVLASLNHPHIARLYGSGTTPEGQAYLVMEYVQGERLDRFCDTHGLSIGERLALFRKVCAAVSYAHQNLVVHRDLKPANIRVTPEGEPKLLDFGIAKLLDPEGTANVDPTVTLHGAMTPEYASPEQIKDEPITTASDVYSLGVVLFELLTGQRPFAHLKGRRPDELARAICEEEPPRPSTVASQTTPTSLPKGQISAPTTTQTPPANLRRQLQGDLDNIVAKALQKDPARRYASVAAFSEDLRRHDEGLPVSARQDTLGYRAGKFIRRNKVGVAAAFLLVLALIGGLIATTWQARVALQERDRAHLAQRQAERLDSFLEGLLGSVDPYRAGKDVKVAEVLDAAGQSIDRDLATEPEVLIRAHQTLCRSYRHLGLTVPAERHARAALDLERRLHGPDDPATARAEITLADALTTRHLWDEADAFLHHALATLRRQLVPDHAALADVLRISGYSLTMQDRTDEAEPVVVEAFSHARAAWGEQSSDYANVLLGLAVVKFRERDFAAAEDLNRRLLALQDRLFPDGGHSMAPLLNLGLALFNQEKLPEARRVADRMERDARRLCGENSVYYAIPIFSQGVMDFFERNYQTAIPHCQQALPLLSAAYPPGQMTLVHCRALLGLCLTRTGQAAEGEPLLRTAFADGAQVGWFEFAHTCGNLETALGECLLAQGHYAEAEGLLLTGYENLQKRLGPQNRLTLQANQRLHDLYTAWNKPAEAARYASTPQDAPGARTH